MKSYNSISGQKILIRDLKTMDLDRSHDFFQTISKQDRIYFRSDVLNKDHLEERIIEAENGEIIRRIALINDKIVADISFESATRSWKFGEAYFRMVISPEFENIGLQQIIAIDICEIANEMEINKIIVKFMSPQINLQNLYQDIGFKVSGILFDYVKDQTGKEQDFVVLSAGIEDIQSACTTPIE